MARLGVATCPGCRAVYHIERVRGRASELLWAALVSAVGWQKCPRIVSPDDVDGAGAGGCGGTRGGGGGEH